MSDEPKKKIAYREQKENELLWRARKYARMKLFGAEIKNDSVARHNIKDAQEYAESLGREVLWACEELLLAMSIDEIDGELQE